MLGLESKECFGSFFDLVRETIKLPCLLLLSYREGSVVADMVLTFNQTIGQSEVGAVLTEAAKDKQIGDIPVSEVVTGKFFKPKEEDEPEDCDTFFEGKDCKGMYSIIIIIFCYRAILFKMLYQR